MSGVQKVRVTKDDDGIKLDRWFKRHYPGLSFIRIQKLMRKGDIRLDGKRVKGKEILEKGMIVRVPPLGDDAKTAPDGTARKVIHISDDDAKMMQDSVLYRDDQVIVINKPAGLATQGGTGLTRHVDGMLDALKFGKENRPRLVHRLDKDTSGVLLLGRSSNAAAFLTKAFQSKETDKRYWALVVGTPSQRQGRIKMMMDKLPGKYGERMVETPEGKPSLTDYFVVEHAAQRASWLSLKPHTGRTHQLRLHCAEMGHPIVGDGKYGDREQDLTGAISRKLHLHARFLNFPHPDGGMITVTAPLPSHMEASFDTLGFDEREYIDLFTEELT